MKIFDKEIEAKLIKKKTIMNKEIISNKNDNKK